MMPSRRRSLSNIKDSTLDWFETYALALTLAGIVLVTVAAVAVLVADTAGESASPTLGPAEEVEPTPPMPDESSVSGVTEYVNPSQGYGFAYPPTWTIREEDRLTRLESPNGRIRVLFRTGMSGDLEIASSRLLDSLADITSNEQLIGVTREQIDGARSLLVSGTATDEAGEPVRFLAITVRGDPHNYAISIFVPRASDPVRVLPRIEEIVASFDVLGTGTEIEV
jgi:PsbP-like protein